MNRTIVFFAAMLFTVSVFGQEEGKEKKPFPFEEFSLSVNRTNMSSSGNENRFGGGVGMYHPFVLGKQFDLMLGIEYNYTSLFVDHISQGMHYYGNNMTLHIHTFSVPLALRFSMGQNVKYFLESGVFFGALSAGNSGDSYVINPLPTPEDPWDKKPAKLDGERGFSYGFSFGTGVKIPMKRIEWVVKADYKIDLKTLKTAGYLHHQYYRLGVGIRKNASYKKP